MGKLRHSTAQGPQLLGDCRWERGTLLAAQGAEGPSKSRAESAQPPPAPAKPEEQPKVISKTLRGLFKAAAGGRARPGLGWGGGTACDSKPWEWSGTDTWALPCLGGARRIQGLDPSAAETARAGLRVHTPGSCFLGLLCSRGSQTCLQSLGCKDCLSRLLGAGVWGHWLIQAPGNPGTAGCHGAEPGKFPFPFPFPFSFSLPSGLLLTFGFICMWVGGWKQWQQLNQF